MRNHLVAFDNLLITESGLARCCDISEPTEVLGLDQAGRPAWREVIPSADSLLESGYYLVTECEEVWVHPSNAVFCSSGPKRIDGNFDLFTEDVRDNKLEFFPLYSHPLPPTTRRNEEWDADFEYLLGAFCRRVHHQDDRVVIRIPRASGAREGLLKAARSVSRRGKPRIVEGLTWDWLIIDDDKLAGKLHSVSKALAEDTPRLFRLAMNPTSRFMLGILEITRDAREGEECYRTPFSERKLRQLIYHSFCAQDEPFQVKPVPYYRPLEVEVRACSTWPPFARTQSFVKEDNIPFVQFSVTDEYWAIICNLVILS